MTKTSNPSNYEVVHFRGVMWFTKNVPSQYLPNNQHPQNTNPPINAELENLSAGYGINRALEVPLIIFLHSFLVSPSIFFLHLNFLPCSSQKHSLTISSFSNLPSPNFLSCSSIGFKCISFNLK